MKQLSEIIKEALKDKWSNPILSRKDIDLDVLKNALYSKSLTKDRATIYVGDMCWDKIDRDLWKYSAKGTHSIGDTITSDELWNKYVKPSNDVKMYIK